MAKSLPLSIRLASRLQSALPTANRSNLHIELCCFDISWICGLMYLLIQLVDSMGACGSDPADHLEFH